MKPNAPKWYRQMFNKELKAKTRQAMIKLREGKEPIFPKFVKNMNWYWF